MGSTSDTQAFRRKVFYVPGYDPFPPRRYRELYRREGAAQAALSNYALALQASPPGTPFGWRVETDIEGQRTYSEVEVLVWSDIVQASFHDSILRTYLALLRTAWIYVSTGALWRLMQLRKGPVIAALYPVVVLLAQLAVAVLGGLAVGYGVRVWAANFGAGTGGLIFWVVALIMATVILRGFRRIDAKIFAHYLMHDFAHSAAQKGAYSPEISARLADFAGRIEAALRSDVDEVLVVGHSSGAHLAVTVLADLIRAGHAEGEGTRPALSLLSLGQVVPMVSFLPQAQRLRGDLRFLSQQDTLTWIDVTAPGDGCAFALCDPVGVSGQASPAQRWPLVFSAAFTQSLSPARWRALRWRFFRLHFQYLCAFDQPRDYDYFQITAGPIPLRTRYAGRSASVSRITHTVSGHTAITP